MRGLDLESTRTLLDKLQRELRGMSNRAAALAHEGPPEHGDELGYLASDIAASMRSSRCCSTERTPFCTASTPQAKGNSEMTRDCQAK